MEELLSIKLRPKSLKDIIGQEHLVGENKVIYNLVKNKKLFSMILYGHPGIGKTSIATAIAEELGMRYRNLNAVVNNKKDFDTVIEEAKLYDGLIVIVDEIHRLNKNVEEILYPALEDFTLDIVIGKGPTSKSIRIDLPKFTLIGATTKAGSLSTPLRDRFGIVNRLELYDINDLKKIVKRTAQILNVNIDDTSAEEIARRSRGTPRIANRLLKRVRDYAIVLSDNEIDLKLTKVALNRLEIDELGLDEIDRKILETMIEKYGGRPVGIDTLATTVGEEVETIEDVYEPYLIQIGFISRTIRGRIPLPAAYEHMGYDLGTV